MRFTLFVLVFCSIARAESRDIAARISADAVCKDIAFLADDKFKGRASHSDEARQVAAIIADRFKAAGLVPTHGKSEFLHAVRDPAMAPNVIGVRPGRGGDFVIVSAHYDHLGVDQSATTRPDRIYNGADDNASGVAAMLAIADALHAENLQLESSIVFIAFTGEEDGLRGARVVAGEPPFPLARIRGMFNMDMISRGEDDLIFVDGGKEAGKLRDALRAANESAHLGLRIKFDEHPDWIMRSDQGPFIRRKVPAVLFSVEDHPDYHQVTDHADKILPKLVERVTKLVLLATVDLADQPTTQPTTQGE